MFGSFQNAVIMSALKRLPGMAAVIDLLLGPFIRKMQIENFNYSKVRVEKRLSADPSSPDLWTQVLERAGKDGEPSMSLDEMFTTAATFMIAGTETTSTLLRLVLIHNPITAYTNRFPTTAVCPTTSCATPKPWQNSHPRSAAPSRTPLPSRSTLSAASHTSTPASKKV